MVSATEMKRARLSVVAFWIIDRCATRKNTAVLQSKIPKDVDSKEGFYLSHCLFDYLEVSGFESHIGYDLAHIYQANKTSDSIVGYDVDRDGLYIIVGR